MHCGVKGAWVLEMRGDSNSVAKTSEFCSYMGINSQLLSFFCKLFLLLAVIETVLIFLATEFAKQTGDFRSLSVVDLKVLALTYQLEKEHCGIDHIKTKPTKQVRTYKIQCTKVLLKYSQSIW